jgi:hypothetical protein
VIRQKIPRRVLDESAQLREIWARPLEAAIAQKRGEELLRHIRRLLLTTSQSPQIPPHRLPIRFAQGIQRRLGRRRSFS